MSRGLVLYHNCLEIFEILNLEKVRAKYAAWNKFAVTSTDIISAKGSVVTDPLGTGASAFPYMVSGTRNAVTTAAGYDSLIKDYLSAQNGKEARLTIMYGAGNKDCLKPIYKALEAAYTEKPDLDLKLLKLEVVTCRYSQDSFTPHEKELGTTAYKSQESQGKKSKGRKNPQNDLIKLCTDHAVPFCLKYPVCYVNPGVFVRDGEFKSTDEIAYFKNYSEVSPAPTDESLGRYAMKVNDDFLDDEDNIMLASKKHPGTKVGFYNQYYFNYVTTEKRNSIELRSIDSKKVRSPAAETLPEGTAGGGAGGVSDGGGGREVGAAEDVVDRVAAEIESLPLAKGEDDEVSAEGKASYSPSPTFTDRLGAGPPSAKKGKTTTA